MYNAIKLNKEIEAVNKSIDVVNNKSEMTNELNMN